ncbi:MAG: chlorophyll synthesis pathway protein BchC [Ahrensia sp.]
METKAIVLTEPRRIEIKAVKLTTPADSDVQVKILWSAISTGTEKMLWEGSMPNFPGMGYPLVPGYEAVGRISKTHRASGFAEGDLVFVPGAQCYANARGLFGANAQVVNVPAERLIPLPERIGSRGVLLALAATAYHTLNKCERALPELIIGHGVLGRLLARLTIALDGDAPLVWESNPHRRMSDPTYNVIDSVDDVRRDYSMIVDASGATGILDQAVSRLAKGGDITLAGFYNTPVSFDFPAAFMREMTLRIAAEFEPSDVRAVIELISEGRLDLDGLITHTHGIDDIGRSYEMAFTDPDCLKLVFDWEQ